MEDGRTKMRFKKKNFFKAGGCEKEEKQRKFYLPRGGRTLTRLPVSGGTLTGNRVCVEWTLIFGGLSVWSIGCVWCERWGKGRRKVMRRVANIALFFVGAFFCTGEGIWEGGRGKGEGGLKENDGGSICGAWVEGGCV